MHLSHALKFSQAKYVAYFTRSNIQMENNDLIEGVLSSHSAEADDYPELCQYEIDSTSGKQCIHTLMISNIEWIDPQIKCAIFNVNIDHLLVAIIHSFITEQK